VFHLPLPADRRLKKICHELIDNPALDLSLPMWGARVGGSARTLARRFLAETGITFAQWRQRARLLASFPRLARGDSIAMVAMDLGYDSPSAFSAMFRKALGSPPTGFMAQGNREIAIP
jgi:AraC-like DNA-binding protein